MLEKRQVVLAIPAGNHRCRRDDSGSAATICTDVDGELMIIGITAFTAASAASALVPSIGVLIAARRPGRRCGDRDAADRHAHRQRPPTAAPRPATYDPGTGRLTGESAIIRQAFTAQAGQLP
jgi:hypothetical protein